MPLRKQGTLVKGIAFAFAASAAVASMPAAASAAACAPAPTTKAFSDVGDTADYSLAPGGDFESSAGWSFTGGAKIVAGNETVGVADGTKSLSLPFKATSLSPSFCVDQTNPYFRFAAKPTNSLAGYKAIVLYKNGLGQITQTQFTSSSDASWGAGTWGASKISPLATKIPLADGAIASVQLLFVSTGNLSSAINLWGGFAGGTVGTTNIDSVEVDPYRRG